MLLQQLLEKIMRKKKFSKLVSSCQYYCLLGTVHTTSSAGGFDYRLYLNIDCFFYNALFPIWEDSFFQGTDCAPCTPARGYPSPFYYGIAEWRTARRLMQ